MKMYPAYYIICVNPYEYEGKEFYFGYIEWKPKGCRPIINPAWRKATDEEVDDWLKKGRDKIDMRTLNPTL